MLFDIIITPSGQLTEIQHTQAGEIDHIAFSSASPEPEAAENPQDTDDQIVWAKSDYHVLGMLDGTIVSITCLFLREVRVGDEVVRVAGVGNVATHPQFQRRGFAGLLLGRAEFFIREILKTPFALLVCSPHREAYYQKFGWKTITAPMIFDTPKGKETWPELTMVLSINGQSWPSGSVDLCGPPW